MNFRLLFIFGICVATQAALASEEVAVEVLTKNSISWDGSPVRYPKQGAEITVMKISVPDGAEIPLHCHPVPLAAYMLSGAIEVVKSSGEKRIFRQGEAFIEVMNQWHQGTGIGAGTELVVFFAGQQNAPVAVKKNATNPLSTDCNE